MPDSFRLSILAADKAFYNGESLSLVIPTTEGSYGVMAHHMNMIAAIVPGILKATLWDGKERSEVRLAVTEGIIKVENNSVLVLVDSLERPEEIELVRAERELQAAKAALQKKSSVLEHSLAAAKLARALNRIRAKEFIDKQQL